MSAYWVLQGNQRLWGSPHLSGAASVMLLPLVGLG